MVKFICLFGKKRSGKDTFAQAFASYIDKNMSDVLSLTGALHDGGVVDFSTDSFAYHLRQLLGDTYGIPDEVMWSDNKDQLIEIDRLRWENLGAIVQEKYPGRTGYMTLRKFLQVFGTDVIRNGWEENFWAYYPFMKYKQDNDRRLGILGDHHGKIVMITDCRFENEVRACKEHGGVVIQILRPALKSDDTHPSENQDIPDELFDFTISGVEGVEPFTRQIHKFLDENKERIFGNARN